MFREPGGAATGVSGQILDYTGREITIKLATDGTPHTYGIDNIDTVEYAKSSSHDAGLASMQARRWEDAVRWFDMALAEEQRRWVRREILAREVECEMRQGHYGAAATKFLTIVESDPDTFHYNLIPLIWTPQQLTDDDIIRARQWIDGTVSAGQLIAASFLIDNPQYSDIARKMLRKLSTHPDGRILGLARAQSWRERLSAGAPTADELHNWSTQIEAMPQELRAGPYYLLGRGRAMRQQHLAAAEAFLWIPLVYDHDPLLAARAALEAAHALNDAGREAEAQTLFREVVTRYATTPYAGEAKAALKTPPQ